MAEHVYVTCSNCNAKLLDLLVTRPHEPGWKVRANCPFCDEGPGSRGLGGSYVTDVPGGFCPAGYDPTEDGHQPSTAYEGPEPEGDVLVFTVIKAHPNAKPCY